MNEFWYNMSPYDPLTISVAISLMLAVAIIAGFFPARRASQVDPVIALRSE
jgi:ABC-type antimicrobial peptide transport system permease subunit